jgi:uncharacterized membrane protein YoaK (UPF0700 family)
MGLQNALVTKISDAVVRTTHLTGIVTDIAIESVRIVGWVRAEARKRSLLQRLDMGRLLFIDPEWRKLRLHVLILSSFLVGAIVGPGLFLQYGQVAMIAPCLVLVVLAAIDFAMGIGVQAAASTTVADHPPSPASQADRTAGPPVTRRLELVKTDSVTDDAAHAAARGRSSETT